MELLIEIKEQTGVVAPELAALPVLPEETAHIWDWYRSLSGARSAGLSINAISWSDMGAYFHLNRIHPDVWEVEALRALDGAFLESRTSKVTSGAKDAGALRGQITGKDKGDSRQRRRKG